MKPETYLFWIVFWIVFFSSAEVIAQSALTRKTDADYKYADAIIQEETIKIEIDKKSCRQYIHSIITLLNDNKKDYADFYEVYDKNTSVKFINGVFTNAKGDVIKKIKRSDLSDVADLSAFATDMRTLSYDLPVGTQYPVTVEYEYEITTDFLLYIPSWNPVPGFGFAVKHSSYSISCEDENAIRFLEKNNAPKAVKSVHNNKHIYTWELNDFAAVKKEDFSPLMDDIAPVVLAAPNTLSYDNYSNKFQNWEDFGDWIAKLNNSRKNIPDELKRKLFAITEDKISVLEKAKAVYEFMQNNTRYVSIQFGIGGFQPADAEKVFTTGYGDCKALSNYMVTLLNSINIPAYYTLVKAGLHKNIIKEFPANQFNHVITCLPVEQDTVWLECTSQKISFGYLGDFTDDRDVLVIAPKPFITHTRKYNSGDNTTTTSGSILITDNGDATCNFTLQQTGLNTEFLTTILDHYNFKEQQQKLTEYFNFKNIELDSFSFQQIKDKTPSLTLSSQLSSREYASKTSSRLFIPVNRLHHIDINLLEDTSRKLPVMEYDDYSESDSILFVFPEGYIAETKDSKYNTQTVFGYYEYQIIFKNNTAIYKRKLVINRGKYSPAQYSGLYAFYKDIALKDGLKIVLKKIL